MPITTEATTRLAAAGDLVVHGDQATLFGPVGTPVPTTSRARAPQALSAVAPDAVPQSPNAAAGPVSGRVAVRDTAERLGLSGRRRAGIVADFAVFDEWGS
jgi:hypothetical protein